MTDEQKNEADGPGESVLDEPTAHALDPETDPNTEWEQKAADQVEGKLDGDSASETDSKSEDEDGTAEESTPAGDGGPS